ncbi:unnamed protein product [Microthlaspi erraticum]|uniref:Uncharacterized protein n=1 Tax=Microthlaspi erraticum TaxID=1685480 RepID=A0A6D2L2Q5_9BRAS|nr:unnamed protein product [Microthlaspi erraticum]
MGTTNVAAKLPSTRIVRETPSLLRTWWMNKYLQYDVAMSSFIIIINIAAIVHMRTHKIPFNNDNLVAFVVLFGMIYIISGIFTFFLWFMAIEDVTESEGASYAGRVAHGSHHGLRYFLRTPV